MTVFDRSKLGAFGFRGSFGSAAARVEPADLHGGSPDHAAEQALDTPVAPSASADPAEPSMDEILASIRKIIADDDAGAEAVSRADYDQPPGFSNTNAPGDIPHRPQPDPQARAGSDLDADLEAGMRALMNESAVGPVMAAAQRVPTPSNALNVDRYLSQPAPAPRRPTDAVVPIVSAEEVASLAAERWLEREMPQLEAAVQEVVRPVVRQWLSENLPSMVERLIREEIEAVSRGRTG